jgi:Zn-dependent protease with chaperone function
MQHRLHEGSLGVSVLVALLAVAQPALPQDIDPGFNLFSVEQDIEIGRESAAQAERELPLLRERFVDAEMERLLRELAANAPGARYPYQVKVVDASDVNAFALPGGPLYVNRGLIEAARSRGELAGVMAHEIAHIALRHGTHQASKAYLSQAGLGVLGGLIGRGGPSRVFDVVGGLGLNALFLKYSRDAERDADLVGARMLARAGLDPMDMARFFDVLQRQRGGDPGRLEQFLSSHPAPADRAARIRAEAERLGSTGVRRASLDDGFERMQQELGALPASRRLGDVSRGADSTSRTRRQRTVRASVEPPSSRYVAFRQRRDFFELERPENWRAYEADNGFGVTLAPEGGVVDLDDGRQALTHAVIVNHYDPFEGRPSARGVRLEDALADLIAQLRRTNPHLRQLSRAPRRERAEDARALSQVMEGRSPVTGEQERLTVFTRELGDGHVLYALLVAPARDYDRWDAAFWRMIDSLRVDDGATHGD